MRLGQVLKHILVVGVLLLIPATFSDAPKALAEGEYAAGVERLPPTPLSPEIWVFYPTSAPAERVRFGPWALTLAENAPMISGRHPVVVISHGLFGGPLDHHLLAEELARAGLISIAPQHDDGPAIAQRYTRRSRDISIALDTVLTHSRIAAHIDIARIGAFGFSLGGTSVLAAAGGRIDFERVRAHCRATSADPIFCSRPGVGTVPGMVPLVPDARLRAVVLAAPIGVAFSSLDAVTADVWIIRAGQDKKLRFPYHAEWIRGLMRRPYRYSFEPDAHHDAFLSPSPGLITDEAEAPARDPAGFDRKAFQASINQAIAAYFSATLSP